MMAKVTPRCLLVDTASLYFRAFYGLPDSLRGLDGREVNAVRGLLDFLTRLITDFSPTHLVCCWDDDWRPQWRVDLLASYKTHRVGDDGCEDTPIGLGHQVPQIREVLAALGVSVLGLPGYEADDVIGTLAATATMSVDVVTGDRDLFQVVDDARDVRVIYVGKGIAKAEVVTEEWVFDRYGVVPGFYAEMAVLRGDPSDGIPGVAGIGEKTAAKLLTTWGSLSAVQAAAASGQLTPRQSSALTEAKDYVDAALPVVRVGVDLPVVIDETARLPTAPVDPAAFARLTADLNLGSSAERIIAALRH